MTSKIVLSVVAAAVAAAPAIAATKADRPNRSHHSTRHMSTAPVKQAAPAAKTSTTRAGAPKAK